MTQRPVRGAGADVAAALGTFLALGVVCGVVWWMVADPALYTKTAEGAQMSEVELSRRFGVDGWYAVIAAVAGFLSGVAVTWWRSRDLRLTTGLVLAGSALAAAAMALVGRVLGPGDPERAIDAAAVGDRVPLQLVVDVDSAYLIWPIAVLAGALMVLWSTPRVGEQALAEDVYGSPEAHPDPDSWDDPFRERARR